MNLIETFMLTFSTIWAHKLRSFLTLLGMIIGITSFMVILSLVQGFTAYIDEKIAKIGPKAFTDQQFGLDDFKKDAVTNALRKNRELMLEELDFIMERARIVLVQELFVISKSY